MCTGAKGWQLGAHGGVSVTTATGSGNTSLLAMRAGNTSDAETLMAAAATAADVNAAVACVRSSDVERRRDRASATTCLWPGRYWMSKSNWDRYSRCRANRADGISVPPPRSRRARDSWSVYTMTRRPCTKWRNFLQERTTTSSSLSRGA